MGATAAFDGCAGGAVIPGDASIICLHHGACVADTGADYLLLGTGLVGDPVIVIGGAFGHVAFCGRWCGGATGILNTDGLRHTVAICVRFFHCVGFISGNACVTIFNLGPGAVGCPPTGIAVCFAV